MEMLQHGLDLRCFSEVSTRFRPHFIDSDAIRKLDERQPFREVDIKYTLL